MRARRPAAGRRPGALRPGPPDRLRPHCKTHKIAEITQLNLTERNRLVRDGAKVVINDIDEAPVLDAVRSVLAGTGAAR